MIVGVGHDLVEIERIRRTIHQFAARFLDRIFTADELHFSHQFPDPAPHLAARFAAKEAAAKALGTGMGRRQITWLEIEITREPDQAPVLRLHGAAARWAGELGITHWHLTLSHTHQLASAMVIAERR